MLLYQTCLSLVICVVISLSLWWAQVIQRLPKLSDIAIQYTRQRLFCFYILLVNGFMSFQAKVYEINMYLLLHLSFKISVGITSYSKTMSSKQHYNAIYVML